MHSPEGVYLTSSLLLYFTLSWTLPLNPSYGGTLLIFTTAGGLTSVSSLRSSASSSSFSNSLQLYTSACIVSTASLLGTLNSATLSLTRYTQVTVLPLTCILPLHFNSTHIHLPVNHTLTYSIHLSPQKTRTDFRNPSVVFFTPCA